jgi:uncharacterized protein YbjT (DUF2867 family)
MAYSTKTACIFGGTGFIGRQVVRELARLGFTVKVATRIPERAYFLKPCGTVAQIVPFACDYTSEESLIRAIKGCEIVVNCIGILFEKGKKNTFEKIHTELPEKIARICKAEDVQRFVHISALGADKGQSKYAQSKLAGEKPC